MGRKQLDYPRKVGDWNITCFKEAQGLIIMDRKLNWYDKDKMEGLRKELKKRGYKCFFDADYKNLKEEYSRIRKINKCRIEIYAWKKKSEIQETVTEINDILNVTINNLSS